MLPAVSAPQPRPVIGATYALAPVGDAYRQAAGGQVIGARDHRLTAGPGSGRAGFS